MKLHLIEDAGEVWHRLWSVRLAILAASLDATSVALNYLMPDHPRPAMGMLAGLVSAAAALARLVSQPKLKADVNA